jgi:hypothetical protein
MAMVGNRFRVEEWPSLLWTKTEISDGCRRLALRTYEENSSRPGGRCWRAGRVAVYLTGSRRNQFTGDGRSHALQGLAAVRARFCSVRHRPRRSKSRRAPQPKGIARRLRAPWQP